MSAAEKNGDLALARGDRDAAAAHYRDALARDPIMDVEHARLTAKVRRVGTNEASSKLDALRGERSSKSGVEYAKRLMQARREARAAKVTRELADGFDAELVQATETAVLLQGAPSLDDLFALLDVATAERAGLAIPRITDAIIATIGQGLPELRAKGGIDALEAFLALRDTIRFRKLPVAVDAALDRELGKLSDVSIPAVTASNAAVTFDRAMALRDRAQAAGAPQAAIALALRARDAALPHLIAGVETLAMRRHYVAAYEQLVPRARLVETGHALLTRLDTLRAEAIAWHSQQAAARRDATRLLHVALVRAFESKAPAATELPALRKALAVELGLDYGIAWTFNVEPACGNIDGFFTAPSADAKVVLRGTVNLRCKVDQKDWSEQSSRTYAWEEEYETTEIVRDEQSVGGDDKCSALSLQSGTCRVTHVITETPVTTKHTRINNDRVDYRIQHRSIEIAVSGSATLTAEDGSTHTVSISDSASTKQDAWKYEMPPEKAGGPKRGEDHPFSNDFTASEQLRVVYRRALNVSSALRAKLDGERAGRMRAQALDLRASAPDAAGEAFIRAALLEGTPTAETSTWFADTHGLSPAQVRGVLMASASYSSITPTSVAITATPYAPAVAADVTDSYEQDIAPIKPVSGDLSHKGIRPPIEGLGAISGLLTYSLGQATGRSPLAVTAGIEMFGAPIEKALPLRYGFVIHDEVGGRIYGGYGDGGFSWAGEGFGRLYAGFRTHHVGVFVGAGGGYVRANSGETRASGWHAEPTARIAIRFAGVRKMLLQAHGFVANLGDTTRLDRITIGLPVFATAALNLTYETVALPTTADGTALGRQELRIYGVSVGGSL